MKMLIDVFRFLKKSYVIIKCKKKLLNLYGLLLFMDIIYGQMRQATFEFAGF